jgi:hypothetical protein
MRWLASQGFDRTFLDIDKHGGILPGANWERRLYREIDGAQAIILILTPNWLDSKWCLPSSRRPVRSESRSSRSSSPRGRES